MTRTLRFLAITLAMGLSSHGVARAHPHVWITAKSELVADAAGAIVAVRAIWVYDEASTHLMLANLDQPAGRRPDDAVLTFHMRAELDRIAEHGYFIDLSRDGRRAVFGTPDFVQASAATGLLFLTFQVPLVEPMPAGGGRLRQAVYDPDFFADMKPLDGAAPTVDGPLACEGQAVEAPVEKPAAKRLPTIFDYRPPAGYAEAVASWFEIACR